MRGFLGKWGERWRDRQRERGGKRLKYRRRVVEEERERIGEGGRDRKAEGKRESVCVCVFVRETQGKRDRKII
jgi:hypothetical protein